MDVNTHQDVNPSQQDTVYMATLLQNKYEPLQFSLLKQCLVGIYPEAEALNLTTNLPDLPPTIEIALLVSIDMVVVSIFQYNLVAPHGFFSSYSIEKFPSHSCRLEIASPYNPTTKDEAVRVARAIYMVLQAATKLTGGHLAKWHPTGGIFGTEMLSRYKILENGLWFPVGVWARIRISRIGDEAEVTQFVARSTGLEAFFLPEIAIIGINRSSHYLGLNALEAALRGLRPGHPDKPGETITLEDGGPQVRVAIEDGAGKIDRPVLHYTILE